MMDGVASHIQRQDSGVSLSLEVTLAIGGKSTEEQREGVREWRSGS